MHRRSLALAATVMIALAACGDRVQASAATGDDAPARAARGGAPTEADIKAVLTRRIKSLATGVGSSHSAVDIAFQSIQIAPGRAVNQQDRYEGIRGATTWPVRARWTEHRRWGAGGTEDVTNHYAYDFYRDDFGEWNYLGHGPVR